LFLNFFKNNIVIFGVTLAVDMVKVRDIALRQHVSYQSNSMKIIFFLCFYFFLKIFILKKTQKNTPIIYLKLKNPKKLFFEKNKKTKVH